MFVLIVVSILDKALVGASQVEYILVMLGANLVIVLATMFILRKYARVERKRIGEERPVAISSETELNELVGQE